MGKISKNTKLNKTVFGLFIFIFLTLSFLSNSKFSTLAENFTSLSDLANIQVYGTVGASPVDNTGMDHAQLYRASMSVNNGTYSAKDYAGLFYLNTQVVNDGQRKIDKTYSTISHYKPGALWGTWWGYKMNAQLANGNAANISKYDPNNPDGPMIYSNKFLVYCIAPSISRGKQSRQYTLYAKSKNLQGYNSTIWKTIENASPAYTRNIELYALYGYGNVDMNSAGNTKENHAGWGNIAKNLRLQTATRVLLAATQTLIWEEVPIKYSDPALAGKIYAQGSNAYNNARFRMTWDFSHWVPLGDSWSYKGARDKMLDDLYFGYIDTIKQKAKNHKEPSFGNASSYDLPIGSSVTLTDSNKVLSSNYRVQTTSNLQATKNGNQITVKRIRPSISDDYISIVYNPSKINALIGQETYIWQAGSNTAARDSQTVQPMFTFGLNGSSRKIKFSKTEATGSLEKLDEDGNPVRGMKFDFYYTEQGAINRDPNELYKTAYSYTNENMPKFPYLTGGPTQTSITMFNPGTYYVVESEHIPGAGKNYVYNQIQRVTVTPNRTGNIPTTIRNSLKRVNLTVEKVGKYEDGTIKPISKAQFYLTDLNGNVVKSAVSTDTNGKVTFTNLKANTQYRVVETYVPLPYKKNSTGTIKHPSLDGYYQVLKNGSNVLINGQNNTVVTLNQGVNGSVRIENEVDYGLITVQKNDNLTPTSGIPGVKFRVYNKDQKTTYQVTTGADGKGEIKVPIGNYEVQEIGVPASGAVKLKTDTKQVSVGKDGNVTITFVNEYNIKSTIAVEFIGINTPRGNTKELNAEIEVRNNVKYLFTDLPAAAANIARNEVVSLIVTRELNGAKTIVYNKPYNLSNFIGGDKKGENLQTIKVPINTLEYNTKAKYSAELILGTTAAKKTSSPFVSIISGKNIIATEGHAQTRKQFNVSDFNINGTFDSGNMVIRTERRQGENMKVFNEKVVIKMQKLPSLPSGYGFRYPMIVTYFNDMNANTNASSNEYLTNTNPIFKIAPDFVDNYDEYQMSLNQQLGSIVLQNSNITVSDLQSLGMSGAIKLGRNGKNETVVYELPEVYIDSNGGVSMNKDKLSGTIKQTPDRKIYLPVWLREGGNIDQLPASTDVITTITNLGVNNINVNYSDTLKVKHWMFEHLHDFDSQLNTGSQATSTGEILLQPTTQSEFKGKYFANRNKFIITTETLGN